MIDEKDSARAVRIEVRLQGMMKDRGLKAPRLAEYIEACAAENVIDHAIRATAFNSFYIHPHGASGPTLDFFLAADGGVLLKTN